MKKMFNHTRKPYQKWGEYERANYDWDGVDDIEEDAEYEEFADEEGTYYADGEYDPEDAEGEYYAEETEAEYYAEDGEEISYAESAAGAYYAGDAEGSEGEYYADEEEVYYEDEEYYAEEEYYEDDEYYAAVEEYPAVDESRHSGVRKTETFFVALWNNFLDMGTMDRIVTATGVLVLVMALITGSVYASTRMFEEQVSAFASIGTELEGIELIGEQGLLAVADAHMARIAAANAIELEDEEDGYDENDYNSQVTVGIDLVSVQKDLKIKFINQKNNKLLSNVPFTVTVTDPKGKSTTWVDDDMDGIIYKKGITPGKYKVSVDAITDTKYDNYTLPVGSETVEVKKEIEYTKIDVSNEIKNESEVNATLEDTKLNETVVESRLEDTVTWVESTSTANTYIEVAKNKIPDPLTLVTRGAFMRMAYTAGINPGSVTTKVGDTFRVEATFKADAGETISDIKWSVSDPSKLKIESAEGNKATIKALAEGNVQVSYTAKVTVTNVNPDVTGGNATTVQTYDASGTCSVSVGQATVGTVAVNKTSTTVIAGQKDTVKATASGFIAGKTLTYAVASDKTNIATASVDANGNITIEGKAAGDAVVTVSVNYKDNPSATAATAKINVKVTAAPVITMSLDKSEATVYINTPVTINATITNAITSAAVTAESSNTGVATVSVNKHAVTITGVKAGSATITVKYAENGVEVKKTCAVVVKGHPRDDKSTKLKDTDGNQLFVLENNNYREATYADYYTFSQFFVKGGTKYTGWQTLNGKVYFFSASGEKVTGEQIIQGAKYNFASDGSLVTGSGTMGIDVSKWNGTIDWKAVKNSGVSYVIIRSGYRGSSQGSLIEDPKFKSNIQGATAAGLKVGIYFFTQAIDEVEAVEEASMVLEQVKKYKISYPIFLDVESSGGRADKIDKATRTAVCKAFCKTIQDAGYTAGIYANKTWLNTKINASELSAYKIWLAQYAAAPTYTGRYDMWQYTSTGKVSGISGNVDLNLSYLGY